MPAFMLHFACAPARNLSDIEKWTADACIIAHDLTHAESQARELIAEHNYEASALIAFSEIDEQNLGSLNELESTLYLKTQTNKAHRAVLFSQWNG